MEDILVAKIIEAEDKADKIVSDSKVTAKNLIDEAVLCMKEAKAAHDELESFYIPAMDFSLVEEKTAKILDLI